jgi:hypothetical protein
MEVVLLALRVLIVPSSIPVLRDTCDKAVSDFLLSYVKLG